MTGADLKIQIQSDLEDQYIHPLSISHNDSFIHRWLEEALAYGGLQESTELIGETVHLEPQHNFGQSQEISTSVTGVSTRATDINPPDFIQEEDVEVTPNTLQEHLQHAEVLGIGNDLSRPPSRTESISSHRSMPDDWRPYDTSNPGWVRSMLLPLFNRDPFLEISQTNPDLRIMRAFHQQDYDRRGSVADHKVLRLCEDIMLTLDLSRGVSSLMSMVYSADSEGIGQLNLSQYTTLMKNFIVTAMNSRKEKLWDDLAKRADEAMEGMKFPPKFSGESAERNLCAHARKHPNLLMWGWSPHGRLDNLFYDAIAKRATETAPPFSTSKFTFIAVKAQEAIETIDEFEEQWLKIVPKESRRRGDFKAPLETVRQLAYRFKILENQSDRQSRSDLDAMIQFDTILLASGASEDIRSLPSVIQLREVQSYAFSILRLIQGFVEMLGKFSRELGSCTETYYYTKLDEHMKSQQVGLLARRLALHVSSADWNEQVTIKVKSFRITANGASLRRLDARCTLLALRYHNRLRNAEAEAKAQLERWSIRFQAIMISRVKSRKLFSTN